MGQVDLDGLIDIDRVLDFIGPFDHHHRIRPAVLFKAQRFELRRRFHAVGVDVVNVDQPLAAEVFIDEHERRAADLIGIMGLQPESDALDQVRLAGAEVADERKDLPASEGLPNSLAKFNRFSSTVRNDLRYL